MNVNLTAAPGDYNLPALAKVSEVAVYLRTSEPTVRELLRSNRIHSVRCGRNIRVPREAVESFVRGNV
jgi:excisionase family DNA binding protein